MQHPKTILITGGNTGIGLATATQLAVAGHTVILACRNQEKAKQAASQIKQKKADADVRVYPLDLVSFDSIRQFSATISADFPMIDVLINNAGAYPVKQQFTEEGFELQFGVNYLGHYLLTQLLLPVITKAPEARIIHVSSIMHNLGKIDFDTFRGRAKYSGTAAYGQSKLANALFSSALAKRLPAHVTSNAVHPGGVDSDIYREFPSLVHKIFKLFLISTDRAGAYLVNMAVGDDWKGRTGEFKSAHGPLPISKRAKDEAMIERLYLESAKLAGVNAI